MAPRKRPPMASTETVFEGRMKVRPEEAERFALWQSRYRETVSSFSGLLYCEIGSPSADSWWWSTRLVFDSQEALAAWLESAERARLLEEVRPLVLRGMTSRFARTPEAPSGVTEAFFSVVRPGALEKLQVWLSRVQTAQAEFPGYLGMVFQPPMKGQSQCTTLIRYDTVEHLEAWLESEGRRELLEELEPLVEDMKQWRMGSSFPGWIPSAPADRDPPANWKVTMLVILGLFPLVMLQMRFLNPWLTSQLPLSPATLVANIVSACLISYLTMPICVRLFGWWLYPEPTEASRTSLIGSAAIVLCYAALVALFWNLI